MKTLDEWEQVDFERPALVGEGGLARMKEAMERLGYTSKPAPTVVLIAGTNGKSSCCRALEGLVLALGKRVGSFTAPHFLSLCERIRIQGQPISERSFCEAMNSIERLAVDLGLTPMEQLTLAALRIFKAYGADLVLLEAALGGRRAPVNVFEADLSILTGIDYDHLDVLGATREHAGYEKAGILRAGKEAILADRDPPATFINEVEKLNIRAHCLGKEWEYQSFRYSHWIFRSPKQVRLFLPRPNLPLPSVGAALMALELLFPRFSLPVAVLQELMQDLSLPGHFQQLPGLPPTILDIASNPQAIRSLFRQLFEREEEENLVGWEVICAMSKGSLFEESLAPLGFDRRFRWYLPRLQAEHGMEEAEHLANLFQTPVQTFENTAQALHRARFEATLNGTGTLVFGSTKVVTECFRVLGVVGPGL